MSRALPSLFVTSVAMMLQFAYGASGFVNLGTSPPPSTVGPFTVTPYNIAAQAAIPDGTLVTSIPGDPRPGGTLTSSINLSKRTVPATWATWSHGYTGPVFSTRGGATVTLTFNPPVNAFYLYVEPNNFGIHHCSAVTNTGINSGTIPIEGNSGATGFGFWDDTNPITSVTITCSASADGFAVGEFGVNTAGVSAPVEKIKITPISAEFIREGYLDFGNTPVNTLKGPAIVKIENLGGFPVYISGMVIREVGFTSSVFARQNTTVLPMLTSVNYTINFNAGERPCGRAQLTLGPGNFCTVGITFNPQTSGRKDAYFEVFINAPNPTRLYVTGNGVSQQTQPQPPQQPITNIPSDPTGAQSGGGGGGCSMSHSASPINFIMWLITPALMLFRRLRRKGG